MKLESTTIEYKGEVYKVTGFNILTGVYTVQNKEIVKWVDMDELEREAKVVEG